MPPCGVHTKRWDKSGYITVSTGSWILWGKKSPTEAKTQLNPGAVVVIGSKLGRSRAIYQNLEKTFTNTLYGVKIS
jgi:thiamine monophosphate kinase